MQDHLSDCRQRPWLHCSMILPTCMMGLLAVQDHFGNLQTPPLAGASLLVTARLDAAVLQEGVSLVGEQAVRAIGGVAGFVGIAVLGTPGAQYRLLIEAESQGAAITPAEVRYIARDDSDAQGPGFCHS